MDKQIIDLTLGETRLITNISHTLFDLSYLSMTMDPEDWEYQNAGHAALVSHLEAKHNAPIIITNGAIQALHAAFYALSRKGYGNLGFRTPYWSRIPEIADNVGLHYTPFQGGIMSQENLKIDSYLLTAPNNPDGYLPPNDTLKSAAGILKEQGIPLIHDAAYYTRTYLPVDCPIDAIGDMQIFSLSKMYGLSSLRLGYIVVNNPTYYQLLLDYMSFSTVGVSITAQKIFLRLLRREEQFPEIVSNFNRASRDAIKKAKKIFKGVDPNKIEIPENFDTICSPFAWIKPKQADVFERAKISVLPGELFGSPGYFRINIATRHDILTEAVRRINAV